MNAKRYVSLPFSTRRITPVGVELGPVSREEQVAVTVYLRRNSSAGPLPNVERDALMFPRYRKYASDEDLLKHYGAAPEDLERTQSYFKSVGLHTSDGSLLKRSITVSGDADAMREVFDVNLTSYEHRAYRFRARTGPVSVPLDLEGVVSEVFGLDTRPMGRSYMHRSSPLAAAGPRFEYTPPQIGYLYQYPTNLDGAKQTLGIFAFNNIHHGGYSLDALRNYFGKLQIPMPQITDVVVHGVGNDPGDDGPQGDQDGDSSGEIMLDLQVAGSLAPSANIVMYFTEFTERGWVDALLTGVSDAQNSPSVISISYGNPELARGTAWTEAAVLKINEAFQIAASKGITVICAAGDQGSSDVDASTRRVAVDFPASSPYVLGCGGTRVEAINGVITREVVWNDGLDRNGGLDATGGGVSDIFALPAYQQNVDVPPTADSQHRIGRGVPDVSGLADPETPVIIIRLDGKTLTGVGGTSATAPLWAALIVRINQAIGTRVGFLNPLLYSRFPTGVLRDIVAGNNGGYRAKVGWDACTGLGSPNGVALLSALTGPGETPDAVTFVPGNVLFQCASCGRWLSPVDRATAAWPTEPAWIGMCNTCQYWRGFVPSFWGWPPSF